MLPSKLFRKSLAALVSFSVMLGVTEVVMRVAIPVRNVGPSFTVFDAERGVSLKQNLSCKRITPEFTMELTTNSLGLRGPEPESIESDGVLFLGDSFTLGYGVNDGEEFPSLVMDKLEGQFRADIPSWNASVGGTGNGRWLKILENEALSWEPNVVVLQVCGNDFDDNLGEDLYRLSPDGELVENEAERTLPLKRSLQAIVESIPGLSYSRLISSLRGGRAAARPANVVDFVIDEEHDALTWALLERAIELCHDQGSRVVLVTAAVERERQAHAETLGVPVINIPSKVDRPELYYGLDGHWNAAGHRAAATMIANVLRANFTDLEYELIAQLDRSGLPE